MTNRARQPTATHRGSTNEVLEDYYCYDEEDEDGRFSDDLDDDDNEMGPVRVILVGPTPRRNTIIKPRIGRRRDTSLFFIFLLFVSFAFFISGIYTLFQSRTRKEYYIVKCIRNSRRTQLLGTSLYKSAVVRNGLH